MGDRGTGGGVREKKYGHCFLLRVFTSYFYSLIMVEFEKVLYSGDLKMVLIFLVTIGLPKEYNVQISKCLTLTHEMLCHAIVSDKPGGLSVCSHPLNQENWQYS